MWVRVYPLFCVAIVAVAVGAAEAGEPQLTPRSVLNDTVVIHIPEDFELMSEDMAQLKYPSGRRPPVVFTNYDGTVNVTIKPTNTDMTQNKVATTLFAILPVLERISPAPIMHKGVVKIGGRMVFFIDMYTSAADTEIRNVIVGAPIKDRLVMFSFNVTRELEEQWIEVGKRILRSIEFRE